MEDYLRRVYLHRYKKLRAGHTKSNLEAKGMDDVIVRIDIAYEGGSKS